MAESADAPDSGSGGSNTVCVQVTLSAPIMKIPCFADFARHGIFCFLSFFSKKSAKVFSDEFQTV